MAGVNKAILVGHLGKDPDIRNLNSGNQVASFSLATSESWRDKNTGDRVEKTEWHNVSVFNENIVKVVESYCKKGSKVYIEGKIRTRKWKDNNSADRYTTEVVLENFGGQLVLLDGKGERGSGDGGNPGSQSSSGSSERTGSAFAPGSSAMDDDIPFMCAWR